MLDPDQLTYVHRTWQVPSEVDSATQPPNWEMFVDGLAEHGSAYDSTNRLHLQGTNRFRHLNSAAFVNHSASQSIATGTFTKLQFDSEIFDTDSLHDTVTNNTRLTAQIAGKYFAYAIAEFSTAGGTAHEIAITKNGAAVAADSSTVVYEAGTNNRAAVGGLYSLAAGDYLEAWVFHNEGININVNDVVSSNRENRFGMYYLGE